MPSQTITGFQMTLLVFSFYLTVGHLHAQAWLYPAGGCDEEVREHVHTHDVRASECPSLTSVSFVIPVYVDFFRKFKGIFPKFFRKISGNFRKFLENFGKFSEKVPEIWLKVPTKNHVIRGEWAQCRGSVWGRFSGISVRSENSKFCQIFAKFTPQEISNSRTNTWYCGGNFRENFRRGKNFGKFRNFRNLGKFRENLGVKSRAKYEKMHKNRVKIWPKFDKNLQKIFRRRQKFQKICKICKICKIAKLSSLFRKYPIFADFRKSCIS